MSNVPKLRFKRFSGDWEKNQLLNIGKIITGSTPSTHIVDYYNGDKLFVSPSDMNTNRFINSTKTTLTELGFSKGRKVEKYSVCFVCIGSTIGKIGQLSEDSITNQQINCITANKDNSNDFIYSLLESNAPKIKLLAGVQAVPQINKTDFSKLKFMFPQKQEQEKIATFLNQVDTKIEQLTKKEKLLQQYKKGVMQKIFNQEIRFSPKRTSSQAQGEADDGIEFCEWEETTVGKNISNIGGTALEKFVSENSTYKFISIGNYSINGKYIDNGQRVEFNEKTKTKLLNKNDLVMVLNDKTSSGDIIGSSILIDEDNKYIYNQRSERITCKDNILPLFLWHYFNSKQFRKKVFSLAQGGTQIYINFPSIKSMLIKLPCLEEQTKIANFLSSIDTKIEQTQKQLEKTKEFKKALLQQMFV